MKFLKLLPIPCSHICEIYFEECKSLRMHFGNILLSPSIPARLILISTVLGDSKVFQSFAGIPDTLLCTKTKWTYPLHKLGMTPFFFREDILLKKLFEVTCSKWLNQLFFAPFHVTHMKKFNKSMLNVFLMY